MRGMSDTIRYVQCFMVLVRTVGLMVAVYGTDYHTVGERERGGGSSTNFFTGPKSTDHHNLP